MHVVNHSFFRYMRYVSVDIWVVVGEVGWQSDIQHFLHLFRFWLRKFNAPVKPFSSRLMSSGLTYMCTTPELFSLKIKRMHMLRLTLSSICWFGIGLRVSLPRAVAIDLFVLTVRFWHLERRPSPSGSYIQSYFYWRGRWYQAFSTSTTVMY